MKIEYPGKIIIYTGFYNRQTVAPYCDSLVKTIMVLERLGIKYDYWACPGDFHVERAFNDAATKFIEDPEATDFFNIDSDMSWPPEAVLRFIMHEEEVIVGHYFMKHKWTIPVGVMKVENDSFVGKVLADGSPLIEAERIALGFSRIKKSAMQKVVDLYPDDYYYDKGKKTYQFIFNEVRDHVFHGMDYCFSDKLKKAAGNLWIDPTVTLGHWGTASFDLNLHKFLVEKKRLREVAKAING